jgi:hypothetical protein
MVSANLTWWNKRKAKTMTDKTGKEVAKLLADFCNNMSLDDREFVEEICCRTHRTLQQSLFGVITHLINEWAAMADSDNFDLRNEATVKACQKIRDQILKDTYLPFI